MQRKFFSRWAVLAATAFTTLTVSGTSFAQDPAGGDVPDKPDVRWNEGWSRFHPVQYATATALVGAAVGLTFAEAPAQSNWTGGILFDDQARSGLALPSEAGRQTANSVSDALLYGLMAQPFFDAGVAASRGSAGVDAAWQMAMINVQSLALAKTMVDAVKLSVGRQRPFVAGCSEGSDNPACADTKSHFKSFPSGHTAMAFTGAGLSCAHHTHLPLYGGGLPDAASCALSLGAASATGAARIMADKHYASDVIAGAAIGVTSGWLVPSLLHYGFLGERDVPSEGPRIAVTPQGLGVGVVGTF